MKAGEKGRIIEISGTAGLKQKLMHMGMSEGREVVKIGHLALRGPVTIKTGRTAIALAHSMAHRIKIEIG